MRRIVVSEFVTLDGVMESPQEWSFPFWNEEAEEFKHQELFASDTLLLGRVTYEGFADAWPEMTDERGFADRMNALPKLVASRTLSRLEWNNSSLLEGDLAATVTRLKHEPGGDILVGGSADLVRELLRRDLVDELRLMVYPIVRGTGKRLFADADEQKDLQLVESRALSSGVVVLTFHPARDSE